MLERQINFIRQQGFERPCAQTCAVHYAALQFQPKVIGVLMLAGVVLQTPALFVALAAILLWSAIRPERNPFDRAYNGLVAAPRGLPLLTPAPGPRRFAQGLAATLLMIITVSLLTGRHVLAMAVEAFLLAAVAAILFGGFCFGSFVFHLLTGNAQFAKRTLPWARGA
jgi:hypothetical protein